jgi:hypothetical protein
MQSLRHFLRPRHCANIIIASLALERRAALPARIFAKGSTLAAAHLASRSQRARPTPAGSTVALQVSPEGTRRHAPAPAQSTARLSRLSLKQPSEHCRRRGHAVEPLAGCFRCSFARPERPITPSDSTLSRRSNAQAIATAGPRHRSPVESPGRESVVLLTTRSSRTCGTEQKCKRLE